MAGAKLSSVSGEVPAGLLGDRSGATGDFWLQHQSGPDNPKTFGMLDKENKCPFRCIEVLMG